MALAGQSWFGRCKFLPGAFLAAGSFKLMDNPMMVQTFDHIGIGQWFRVVTGSVEIAGALLLIAPMTAAFGGVLLATTMACATLTHLAVIGGNRFRRSC